MQQITADSVRDFILERVHELHAAKGLTPSDVPPSFDLLLEGVIDSFGVVELVISLEERFAIQFDFDEVEADHLTRIGPLAAYVERKAASG
jgi:acyl carrier protein